MAELIEANWILLVIALVIAVLVIWWLFVSSRRTRVEIEPPVEGAEEKRIKRNQALIDAPPAAQRREGEAIQGSREAPREPVIPPAAPAGLAGAGEVVQAAAKPEPEPAAPPPAELPPRNTADAPSPPPSPTDPAMATGDDLTRIKGLGPKIQQRLNELGVTTFSQIAAWDDAEIDRVDEQMDRFRGRIRRDNWVEQARLLGAGDVGAYEDKFGKL